MKKIIFTSLLILAFGLAYDFVYASSALAAPSLPPIDASAVAPTDGAAQSLAPAMSVPIEETLIYALSLVGVKYRYGGNNAETGFDCSGFVHHVFAETLKLSLPRNALAMSKHGEHVDKAGLLPGDLVFFNTLRRSFSHVGLYIGEGRFVHAPSRGKTVEIVEMNDSYWRTRFNGARRVSASLTETVERKWPPEPAAAPWPKPSAAAAAAATTTTTPSKKQNAPSVDLRELPIRPVSDQATPNNPPGDLPP